MWPGRRSSSNAGNFEGRYWMLYIIGEPRVIGTTKADQDRFVASALTIVARTERSLTGGEWIRQPTEVENVLSLANFSADLLACIQLWQWETSGEERYLSESLPTYSEAIEDLKTRIVAEPRWFMRAGPSSSELFELVTGVRLKSFRFSSELRTVLLVTEPDENALVEALAQLAFEIWQQQSKKRPPTPRRSHEDDRLPRAIMEKLASIPGITVTLIGTGTNQ
jgi:hypothetical protein